MGPLHTLITHPRRLPVIAFDWPYKRRPRRVPKTLTNALHKCLEDGQIQGARQSRPLDDTNDDAMPTCAFGAHGPGTALVLCLWQ